MKLTKEQSEAWHQYSDNFNELLVACNTALKNQTKVEPNEVINQMKGW